MVHGQINGCSNSPRLFSNKIYLVNSHLAKFWGDDERKSCWLYFNLVFCSRHLGMRTWCCWEGLGIGNLGIVGNVGHRERFWSWGLVNVHNRSRMRRLGWRWCYGVAACLLNPSFCILVATPMTECMNLKIKFATCMQIKPLRSLYIQLAHLSTAIF